MCFQLFVRTIMVTLYRGLLDCSVHALNLAIRPGMFRFCEPVFDTVLVATQIEHMGDPLRRRPVAVARRMAELAAVIGQDRVYLVGHNFDQFVQESRRYFPVRFIVQLRIGELACAVDSHKQIEFSFLRPHFGNACPREGGDRCESIRSDTS